MKILIINGPNLNMLGKRDPEQYGSFSIEDLELLIKKEFPIHEFTFYQSNIEGELVTKIQDSQNNFDAVVINPGGYTHTSVAIKDALEIINIPKIEVHLSLISSREEFRQTLITTSSTDGYISGFKENGYLAAIYLLTKIV
jgi:3-dehydroquinate dehydratase II